MTRKQRNLNTLMPADERPYEKCRRFGPQSLSDAELLAVLLRSGTKGMPISELARKLNCLSDTYPGLLGLYHCSYEQLLSIRGIGEVKALQILCLTELSRRLTKAVVHRRLDFCCAESVADYYMEDMRHLDREELRLLMLDSKNRLLRETVISTGTVTMAPASPREIFREALLSGAVGIILLHNHPSGDSAPSAEDLSITERIRDVGELLGIPLLDHIIIGDRQHTSMNEYRQQMLHPQRFLDKE